MTDEKLLAIINGLNDCSLTHCVLRAKIVSNKIHYYEMLIDGGLRHFYLILKGRKKYVSIAYDMDGTDLHIYTAEKYRRMGLVKKSLPTIIQDMGEKYDVIYVTSELPYVVALFIRNGFTLRFDSYGVKYLKRKF